MRSTLIVGLAFALAAGAVAADAPIPQDAARAERRSRESREWNRRTVLGAYDKVGKKDPRWDGPAREAMDLASRMFSSQFDPVIEPDAIYRKAKAAIDAGCDDPFLVYLSNRVAVGPNHPGEAEATRRLKASAKALAASRYPAFRRAIALELAGNSELDAKAPVEGAGEARHNFDAALGLLPESVADDERNEFWEDKWFETCASLIAGYRKLGVEARAALDRVDSGLARHPELKVLRLQVRGQFFYKYGWEARTKAIAPLVPAGGFEAFEDRLGESRKAFNEAWRLRADDARTASYLLDIEKGIGGDRAAMELWFDRAMKADGDKFNACLTKLDWLDPKWHGTAEEMLAFGRACRATGNWRAGITLLAGDAHLRHYSRLEPSERSKYMGSPEVWSDIKSVYDEYLKHFPLDDAARSKYAILCYFAGHHPEAFTQFQMLGDRLVAWRNFPNLPIEAMKRMRAHTAQIVGAKPRAQDAPAPK